MFRFFLGAVGAIATALTFAQAQETSIEVPSVEIPKDLQVYTQRAGLIETGNEVLDVLKTAKFGNIGKTLLLFDIHRLDSTLNINLNRIYLAAYCLS